MITMLPVHRTAHADNEPSPIQVIGLYEPEEGDDDQWLAIDIEGKPGYYAFSTVRFDGWLP